MAPGRDLFLFPVPGDGAFSVLRFAGLAPGWRLDVLAFLTLDE